MADEEEGFKVRDRRRRSSEDDDAPQAPAGPPVAAPPPEHAAATPPASTGIRAPDEAGPAADRLDLREVFMMFASSALMGLGEAADPVSGQRHIDLAQAEEAIDVLLLLRDKTEGNRSEEESAFLENVLYDLQVRFVELTRMPQS